MGLYLAVFSGDEVELDGVEVGGYDDFGVLRNSIRVKLEGGQGGSRFPILMMHSDCDGEWTASQCKALLAEISVIQAELRKLPPVPLSGWQANVAREFAIKPMNLEQCFFDVDGEPLLPRIASLAQLANQKGLSVLFQ
ncbi:MAG: hypothetical protein IT452_03460 [Planctomycetia bacterium]|nr:hypothetical protein [Planctomycetia bacterium]